LKIIKGVEHSAAKVTLYGTEGIGKTTLASQFPNPLILDTEDGARRIDCAKVKCTDWKTLYATLIELGGDAQGFKTVVIDSIDWAESLLKESLSAKLGKPVDELPYGRSFGVIAEGFSPLLAACDVIVSRGVNVLLVGHSTIKRCTPPDTDEGYDRYELKLSKQVGPLVKEWSDAILFCNYKTRVVEGDDGKNRGKGGKDRVLYAERCAAWDAKNRFSLAAELPMAIDALAPLFTQPKGWLQRVQEAESVTDLGAIADEADLALSSGTLSESQHGKLRKAIDARHNELEPQEVPA
jgi:hypothetical protein